MECGRSLRNDQEKLVCGRVGIAMRDFFLNSPGVEKLFKLH